jgi:raffinose/stachyose/melibiose transport system substrate-binding protein
MKKRRIVATGTAFVATAALLAGCSAGGGGSSDPNTLKLWHFESETSAMGIAWDQAIETFEEETGAKVEFEAKSFEQIRSTASQVLNSDEAPDILEYNKGNATAGLLASQGLLANLDDAVAEYGWDDDLAPSIATTSKYDERGIMGSGSWYGIPNYGEYVEVFYNKDAFAEQGIEVPTTYDEFEAALQTFADAGITPLAEAGGEYPLGQLFYQLALSQADRSFVDDYQLYEGDVDWQGPELTYAAEKLQEYVENGWISKDVTGIKAEDMGTTFMSGGAGSEMAPGSGGNLWVVPENAANKDLATKFIDITMRPEIQNLIGNNGGVPVKADPADITDPKSQELIANFNTLLERDGLAFYPDWPTPTFYDQLVAGTQELVNGTSSPDEMLTTLGDQYQSGVDDITGE